MIYIYREVFLYPGASGLSFKTDENDSGGRHAGRLPAGAAQASLPVCTAPSLGPSG